MEAENEGSLWGWRLEWDETEEEELIMQHLWPSEPPLSLVRSPSPLSPFNFSGLDDFIMQHLWSSEPPLSLFRSPSLLSPSNLSGLDVSLMENMYPSEPPLSLVPCPSPLPPSNLSDLDFSVMANMYPSEPPLSLFRCPSPLSPSNLSGLDVSIMENMYPSELPLTLSRLPSPLSLFKFLYVFDYPASVTYPSFFLRFGQGRCLNEYLAKLRRWNTIVQNDGTTEVNVLTVVKLVLCGSDSSEFDSIIKSLPFNGSFQSLNLQLKLWLRSFTADVRIATLAGTNNTSYEWYTYIDFKISYVNGIKDPIDDNSHRASCTTQNQETSSQQVTENSFLSHETYPSGVCQSSPSHAFEVGLTSNNLQNDDGEKGKRPKSKISLQDIQELLPKKITLVDAAKKLGVSRSTLKRRCREFEITWPSSRRRIQLCSNQSNPIAKLPYRGESSQVIVVNPANPAESLDGVSQPIGLASESQPTMLVPTGTAPLDGQLTAELGSSGDDGRLLGENNLQSLAQMDMSTLHCKS